MSNIEASEENTKSPSTYGDKAYEEYRKIRKKNQKQVLDNDNKIQWFVRNKWLLENNVIPSPSSFLIIAPI